jgi:SAM-dependent methyltransferase
MDDVGRNRTIDDFGDQWTRYVTNEGHYGSLEMFRDILGPLWSPESFRGRRALDVGSGTGRIVDMLVAAGVASVVAVEPSRAHEVLVTNVARHGTKIVCLKKRGDEVPSDLDVDLATSIGVIHHIPDPAPVMQAIHRALRPGGELFVWVYGREGNSSYLRVVEPLRVITRRLPHPLLAGLCHLLNGVLGGAIATARHVPMPMRDYLRHVLGPLDRQKRYLVIYDQLNPHYAKYYRGEEIRDLFLRAGFEAVTLHHRHGYSWTVRGRKPATATP